MSDRDQNQNDKDKDDNKWSGFHFTRLGCIAILTFIIMIVALILDNLSVWGKETESVADPEDTCEANGECGWREGETKWIDGGYSGCPDSGTYTFNYADLCDDDDYGHQDDACMAMDGGNVYLAFTIFALIFNVFSMLILLPLYCRERSIFPCDICDTKTHIFLAILFGLCIFCNLIPIIVWLGGGDGGMCDNADNFAGDIFTEETTNFPGYSIGGLMLCLVANIVACGAVSCCWGDNRHYGEDQDTARVDRQKEKEEYRKEQEMTNNDNQGPNPTYSYT